MCGREIIADSGIWPSAHYSIIRYEAYMSGTGCSKEEKDLCKECDGTVDRYANKLKKNKAK